MKHFPNRLVSRETIIAEKTALQGPLRKLGISNIKFKFFVINRIAIGIVNLRLVFFHSLGKEIQLNVVCAMNGWQIVRGDYSDAQRLCISIVVYVEFEFSKIEAWSAAF